MDDFIVDEVVQSDQGPDKRRHIGHVHEVVRLHVEALDDFLMAQVGQKVEYVLDLLHNVGIDWQLSFQHFFEVSPHVFYLLRECFQPHDLI